MSFGEFCTSLDSSILKIDFLDGVRLEAPPFILLQIKIRDRPVEGPVFAFLAVRDSAVPGDDVHHESPVSTPEGAVTFPEPEVRDSFFEQIHTVDGYLGRIYDTAAANGLLEDALFIVVADHGHTITGGHGGLTMRETNVTLAVAGKTVVPGGKLDSIARNRDVAAITLYALGIERPDHMTARIPANLFKDVKGEVRPFHKDVPDGFLSALAWILTLFTALF